MVGKDPLCIIFGNTVTSICTGNPGVDCQISMPMMYIAGIPSKHASITGTVTVRISFFFSLHIHYKGEICVDYEHHHGEWSREMWQNVVNRAVRLLAASPFGSHFITAFATVWLALKHYCEVF
ncbi:hypothetical protein KIN20_022482 [Parelaphostrongylus tenuis]|uniref:Uncharacterized protein n=1 Tax=Parelaphostrongylus tenuis TaxID=148309 RepID=A0AAD5QVD7_PARTN|nr:hypothetical protein KIN20_022482 [Parelaphostrongylus tenuis]